MAEAADIKMDTFFIHAPTHQSNKDLKAMLNKFTKNPVMDVVDSRDSTIKRKVTLESSGKLSVYKRYISLDTIRHHHHLL